MKTVLAYVCRLFQNSQRTDLIFDRYSSELLNADTRQSRWVWVHIRITSSTIIPQKYNESLQVDENKKHLFTFLAEKLINKYFEGKPLVCTLEKRAISSSAELHLSAIWHKEAAGRLLHAKHGADNGYKRDTFRTINLDVVVIDGSVFSNFENIQILWIDFGTENILDLCSYLLQICSL